MAQSIGVSVSATKPEMMTDPATAMPNSLKRRPVEPFRNASGVKTATSAMVVATTAKPISLLASSAACSGGLPNSSWCRYAFSSTMIASSTTMPMARVRASSVKLLIEKSEHAHDREGRDDGRRDREARDERRADVPEEQEDDQHHQPGRDDEGLLGLLDRPGDVDRLVVTQLEADTRGAAAAWMPGSAARTELAMSRRLALDCRAMRHADGRPAVGAEAGSGRSRGRAPRCPRRAADDLVRRERSPPGRRTPRGLELAQGPDRELAAGRLDAARGHLDVAGPDRAHGVLDREAAREASALAESHTRIE